MKTVFVRFFKSILESQELSEEIRFAKFYWSRETDLRRTFFHICREYLHISNVLDVNRLGFGELILYGFNHFLCFNLKRWLCQTLVYYLFDNSMRGAEELCDNFSIHLDLLVVETFIFEE
jgi:hypothetical protein